MLGRRALLTASTSLALGCTGSESEHADVPKARRGIESHAQRAVIAALPPYAPVHLRVLRDKLAPIHERTAKPKPGEWLHDHPEAGQTLDEYLRSGPTIPTQARRTLVVLPLGELPEPSRRIIELTTEYLGLHFGLPTRRMDATALDAIPAHATRPRPDGRQLLTRWLLDDVLAPRLPADAAALIGFTATDLWPGEGWNFVFGEATLTDRVGVWSLARYGNPADGPDVQRTVLRRALKIAVHETGHMFSLPHCTRYSCVQAGVNSLEEADRSPLWLCADCLPKIAWVTSTDPREHLRSTRAFCAEQGLAPEAEFLGRSLSAIGAS